MEIPHIEGRDFHIPADLVVERVSHSSKAA
jgi:hypothetical protein